MEELNINEVLYLKMVLNSNVEEIDVWSEEEQNTEYAHMIRGLYNKIVTMQNKLNNEK
tara:strand:+ start:871 stop:1044 length:174 start_codon:yes stop_codon:yes gene_type:complete